MLRFKLFICAIAGILAAESGRAQMAFRIGGDSADYGKDIVLDDAGNTIVAGHFGGTVDFDPGAGAGNLTSAGMADNFIVKYDAAGNYRWGISFGSIGNESPGAVAADVSGNIYVCGYFSGETDFDPGPGTENRNSSGAGDAYVAKFDSGGNFIWVNTFGAVSQDEAVDVEIGATGNIYVTGYFQGSVDVDPGPNTVNLTSNGEKDIFVLSYDPNGNYRWAFGSGTPENDEGRAVVLGTGENCYISGYSARVEGSASLSGAGDVSGPVENTDIFIAKCSVNGSVLWWKLITGSGGGSTAPGAIFLDNSENVYISGRFAGTLDFDPGRDSARFTDSGGYDVFVSKYDVNGNHQTSFILGGDGDDGGDGISVNDYGDIYVAGWFSDTVDFNPGQGEHIIHSGGTGGASDIFISKYSLMGDFFWVNSVGASTSDANDKSSASSVALAGTGECSVTGRFFRGADFDPSSAVLNLNSAGSSDIFIVRYDENGFLLTNPKPVVVVNPKNIQFGVVPVDSLKQSFFNLFNTGNAPLVVSSVVSTNPRFTVTPTSATINHGSAGEFIVKFLPTDTLPQFAWIILNHNAEKDKDSVAVSGVGTRSSLSIGFPMATGWNMISFPLIINDYRKTTLFPTSVSDAYSYSGIQYVISETLEVGNGYWLKFDTDQNIPIFGLPVLRDTIHVKEGWNLIGSIAYQIPSASITQIPAGIIDSQFYEYVAGYGYQETSVIFPGKAYWVKAKEEGDLILRVE